MKFSALKQATRSAVQRVSTRRFATSENLVKTACYDLHKELGGDMVPFAGYELPVLYKGENGGVMKEHLWCRADGKAAMFDVSHMGQVGTNQSTI
jgi:aminomethyltransferase